MKALPAVVDPRVDRYIEKAPPFAQPILRHLREIVHAGCPGVEETMKWSRPFFSHEGLLLCNMSAFKKHCSFGFWKREVASEVAGERADEGAGQFGRITRVEDLPDRKTLLRLVADAVKLNTEGPAEPAAPRPKRAEIAMPAEFASLLKDHPAAAKFFAGLSPSGQRDYLEWITEAKRNATRQTRMETSIEWLTAGKVRHWKYQNC